MKMIKQPTIPPMPKRPTFDARDTQYNLPIGTDCISREQAIDALKGCYCGGEDSCGEPWIYESHAIKAIEQLPPIQPSNNSEMPNSSDTISRQAAIDALKRKQDDGKGDLSRFYNTIIQHDIEAIMALPPAEPKRGRWILDRSGAFCCSNCMEPCAGYVMMKPRDKFCKMCGSRNEVTE